MSKPASLDSRYTWKVVRKFEGKTFWREYFLSLYHKGSRLSVDTFGVPACAVFQEADVVFPCGVCVCMCLCLCLGACTHLCISYWVCDCRFKTIRRWFIWAMLKQPNRLHVNRLNHGENYLSISSFFFPQCCPSFESQESFLLLFPDPLFLIIGLQRRWRGSCAMQIVV